MGWRCACGDTACRTLPKYCIFVTIVTIVSNYFVTIMCFKWIYVILFVTVVLFSNFYQGYGEVLLSDYCTIFRYSSAELREIGINRTLCTDLFHLQLPKEIKRRKQDRAGGVKKPMRQSLWEMFNPSVTKWMNFVEV